MKKWRSVVESLGLNFKKEIIAFFAIFSAIIVVGMAVVIISKRPMFLLIPSMGLLIFSFYYFYRYSAMKISRIRAKEQEFVRLFTYFGIYIANGSNVYVSLRNLLPYASKEMNELLNDLLAGIDSDKTVAPFVVFSNHFEDLSIREVILSIYQMVEEGEGTLYVAQFQKLFSALSQKTYGMQSQKYAERLSILGFLPLAGSGITMLVLLSLLMEILGGINNGL